MTYAQIDALITVDTRSNKPAKAKAAKSADQAFAEVAILQRLGGGGRV